MRRIFLIFDPDIHHDTALSARNHKTRIFDIRGFFIEDRTQKTLFRSKFRFRFRCDFADKNIAGEMDAEDWQRLITACDRLSKAQLFIDDTPGISVTELRSKARRIKAEHGLSLVVIDYLQLMQGRIGKNSENRQQEISEISRSLKALARELGVPVIALSQLSRSVELRQIKRPMLSDLRESGSLEQDADIVMFLYREDYYDQETENANITEVIIAKHRNGPIDRVRLFFEKRFTKFTGLAHDVH